MNQDFEDYFKQTVEMIENWKKDGSSERIEDFLVSTSKAIKLYEDMTRVMGPDVYHRETCLNKIYENLVAAKIATEQASLKWSELRRFL